MFGCLEKRSSPFPFTRFEGGPLHRCVYTGLLGAWHRDRCSGLYPHRPVRAPAASRRPSDTRAAYAREARNRTNRIMRVRAAACAMLGPPSRVQRPAPAPASCRRRIRSRTRAAYERDARDDVEARGPARDAARGPARGAARGPTRDAARGPARGPASRRRDTRATAL
jgi:hypothetical protein